MKSITIKIIYTPWLSSGFHIISQSDVVGPHVVLPLPQTQDSAQYPSRMDAHPHVELHVGGLHYAGDGVDHVQAHFHGAMRVVGPGLR